MYLDISIFTYTYTDIRPLTYAYWCVSRSSYKQSLHTDHPWNMGRRKLIDLRVLSLTCHGHYINGSKLFQDTSREFISNHNVTEKNAHASEHNVIYDICDILSSYFEAINCLVRMRMLTVKNEFSPAPKCSKLPVPDATVPRYVLNLTQQDPLASQPLVQLAVKVLKLPCVTPSSVRVATSSTMHAEYNRSPVKQGATVKGGTRHAGKLWLQILL